MANDNMERQLNTVREQGRNRRISVLPEEAQYVGNIPKDPWGIANEEHLTHWTNESPRQVMTMIRELRFERDQCLHVASRYDEMREELADQKKTSKNNETRIEQLKKELLAPFQDVKENVAAPAPPDPSSPVTSNPTPSSSVKYSKSIPDPPFLTDGKDPTWEDWSSKIEEKLAVNHDHYPTARSQIAYVIGRLSGLAATYTTIRRLRGCPNPYLSYEDVMD